MDIFRIKSQEYFFMFYFLLSAVIFLHGVWKRNPYFWKETEAEDK